MKYLLKLLILKVYIFIKSNIPQSEKLSDLIFQVELKHRCLQIEKLFNLDSKNNEQDNRKIFMEYYLRLKFLLHESLIQYQVSYILNTAKRMSNNLYNYNHTI